jgi:hypothetical protein
MSYRMLVLRDHRAISLPVLRKVQQLVEAGVTVVGPRPVAATSLQDSDAEVQKIATELWGQNRVIDDADAREVLLAAGLAPDFEYQGGDADTDLDYIHRRDGDTEIYFVANRAPREESVTCTFRVEGRAPELWDAVSGRRRFAAAYTQADGRTSLPLDFAPCGSWFVVFRSPASEHPATGRSNVPPSTQHSKLTGPWQVAFDPQWGGPGTVTFDELVDWTQRDEPGIRFYSGTAVYRTAFQLPDGAAAAPGAAELWLDLGRVRELAEVKVNGQTCGVTWAPPFRLEISEATRPGENQLEIEVVNFWPNRIIGDDGLPAEQRLTRTNIRKLTRDSPLMESGLFGPVTLLQVSRAARSEAR